MDAKTIVLKVVKQGVVESVLTIALYHVRNHVKKRAEDAKGDVKIHAKVPADTVTVKLKNNAKQS